MYCRFHWKRCFGMYVAVDETDSVNGNCTTDLATEIIRELDDLDLIGNPRLVRLNPAVPWKTRGNGSLVMRFGHGVGEGRLIGSIGGKDVLCHDRYSSWEPDPESLLERIIPLVDSNHEDESDPGVLVSRVKPPNRMYWRGVRTILSRSDVDPVIAGMSAHTYEIGLGRGLIGCTCGMAWRPRDYTYELLSYRPRDRWGTERRYVPSTIRDVEHGIPTTFNSWEDRSGKVAMVPSTPCPVMYGLRGDSQDDLIRGHGMIETEPLDRWIIFLTNQGTDDHIVRNPSVLIPNQSYLIAGTVSSYAVHVPGGHTFLDLDTRFGTIPCAAYEPSKEFRHLFDWLVPGDSVEVMGELRENPRTLNVEKLHLVSTVPEFRKTSNPICPTCSRTMKSIGSGQGFRCKKCHLKSSKPVFEEVVRQAVPGWYEPPTSSRRHLSKPLKRMGEVQRVEFVNGRS